MKLVFLQLCTTQHNGSFQDIQYKMDVISIQYRFLSGHSLKTRIPTLSTFEMWKAAHSTLTKWEKKEIKKKAIYLCEKQKEIFLLEKGEGLVYTLTNKIYINQP